MTSMSDQERERVWELHTSSEFDTLDLDTTMATMSEAPEVLHVPTAMGARGRASVRHFYRRWFVGHNAADFALTLLSRTTGDSRLVDEMLVSFTHDVSMPWILPGVPPTGRPVEIPALVVVSFDGPLISGEHLYWDQTTVLAQIGLLSAETMARLPVVVDQRGTLADGPLNQLAGRG
ncbi:nuclear transport factor 2 family protein [Streptomyces tubercidicus]